MPLRFIPDENIIILAQKQQDDRGAADPTCLRLVQGILSTPRAFMVVNPFLWRKYLKQLNGLPHHSIIRPHLLSVLTRAGIGPPNDAGQWVYKVTLLPNAPDFPEETAIQQHGSRDVQIVRLAVATGAILVTTDQPLREDLAATGIAEKYGLQVVSPNDALHLL